jgi:hypothetical protein
MGGVKWFISLDPKSRLRLDAPAQIRSTAFLCSHIPHTIFAVNDPILLKATIFFLNHLTVHDEGDDVGSE